MRRAKRQAIAGRPGLAMIQSLIVFVALTGMMAAAIAAQAQEPQTTGPQIQNLTGRVEGRSNAYLLSELPAGATIYAYGARTSGNLDPFVAIAGADLDLEKLRSDFLDAVAEAIAAGEDPLLVVPRVANEFFLAWDDDSGEGYDAMLSFEIPEAGNYQFLILASPGTDTFGGYRALVGIDAPEVLTGRALPAGPAFATLMEDSSSGRVAVEVITGTLDARDSSTFFTIQELRRGEIFYSYIEATSGDLRPRLTLEDFGGKAIRTGNFSGQATTTSLQYETPETVQNFVLRIEDCCQDGEAGGEYRLVVGVNAPEVLSGQAEPTGPPIIQHPIEVAIGVKLQQITGVDQKSENFGAVVSLSMEWADSALAFSPDSCNCAFKSYPGDAFAKFASDNNIRWPDFTAYNQQGNRWSQNKVVVVFPEGRAIYFERFTTTFQAPDFDFRHFPLDRQDFYIRVDQIYPLEFFHFVNRPDFSEVGAQLGEEEWVIVDWDTEITEEVSSTQSPTSRFSFHFQSRRHLNFYITRFFIPILIIILVSWVTFFLKDFGKRVDVAAGNLLLFIAYNFTISGDLPRLGYVTLMDTILMCTFGITALVVIINVILKRLEASGQSERAKRLDKPLLWLYPLAYLGAVVVVALVFR